MSIWSRWRRWWRAVPSAPTQRRFRPQLECLEDRCLPSATLGYLQINLASDVPAQASVVDTNMVNPWGVSFSPTGPFWFAESGTGTSDLLTGGGQTSAFTITFANADGTASHPTGTVFNGGTGFDISAGGASGPSRFLFATANGEIFGWRSLATTDAARVVDNSAAGASYTGLALATDASGNSYLYAANFSQGRIDIYDQNFHSVSSPGAFVDSSLPAGYSPYNVQAIGNKLYVTYAKHDASYPGQADYGAGQGYVDVFDANGSLYKRFASGGALDAPWGVAQAPASFGAFSGAILVGNNGDGHISAYDPTSGAFLGQLADDSGNPIAIPGLWALAVGNGHDAGDANTLFFTAGASYGQHGLFGAIQSPDHRGASTAGDGIFNQSAPGEPGDYPLPPLSGPSVLDQGASLRAGTVAMPLSQSSAIVAPTITTFAQTAAPVQANSIAFIPRDPSSATTLLASNTTVLVQPPVQPNPNNSVALNTFLDLRVDQAFRVPAANSQEQVPDAIAPNARAPQPKMDDAGANILLGAPLINPTPAPPTEQLAAASNNDPSASTAVAEQTNEPAERRAESEREQSRDEEIAAGLVRYTLLLLWMPMVGGYCVRRLRRSHHPLAEIQGPKVV